MEVKLLFLKFAEFLFLGSVNEKNSEELIKQLDVDGFLVFPKIIS